MFRYEKEMIPVLEQGFEKKYNNSNIIREFNSGNGIADLAIAIGADETPNVVIGNYNEMYYLTNYFNRIGRKIYPDKLIKEKSLDKRTLYSVIDKLTQGDYLIQSNKYFIVLKLYKPSIKKVFSVEAKLNKWKEGVFQALRYKCYSHKSYLALSSDKIKNVDIALLVSLGIGLISVFEEKIEIVENPPMQKPENLTAYYHLTEKFNSY